MGFVFVSDHDIVPHTFNSSFSSAQVNHTHKIMEISPLEGFSELDWPYSSNHLCFNEFPDLENLDLDFSLPPLGEYLEEELDQKPLNIVVSQGVHCNREKGFGEASSFTIENGSATASYVQNIIRQRPQPVSSSSKKKTCVLKFDEIRKHFGVPITEAAKRLNVGLTMLKRRCRELNVKRWPHRKLKSLQLLIDNVKEMGLEDEVARVEKHKRLLEKLPGMELSEEAKKLRQACFKANYKKRRCMASLQA
ncbi:hypothetical protein GLYMA_04G234600v4 [Glycine max]|uniref:RWP-RK domain-containing protein n=2 Tax=Glycine max TaxID=3847 RepID=K7KLW8_SOYBN|nr:hypothetical protein GYH30_010872 [Glycine max]KAH1255662.1 Protein RKD4 [Glycine max]KRH64417.1 hypothetical protein GLYMA_04G234600v4 [Glycine max]|eukprot:XP_006578896.1 protein RKD4 isoform X1 [Glycine max]